MGIQGEFFERQTPVLELADTDTASGGGSAAGPMRSDSPQTRRMMKDLSIPKLYYSISEVSRLSGIEAYILRYWETEFEELRPQKNRAGNRIYSNRDIKFILRIKDLLREKRYTIEGAKHIIRGERSADTHAVEMTQDPASAEASDPAQLALPSDVPAPLSTALTLGEIHAMKSALERLRSLLKSR